MPEGFREDAVTMSMGQLMKKYTAGAIVVERWLGELQLERAKC